MKAFAITGKRKLSLKTKHRPKISEKEVLIQVIMVGICGSDIHLFMGHRKPPKDLILGHEAVGIIIEKGEKVKKLKIGDRVVIEPNISCGECTACKRGYALSCLNKKIIGINSPGCLAEQVAVPAEYVWKLPKKMSNEDAVLIEPLAVAVHAFKLKDPKKNQRIGIIGLGSVGLLLAELALLKGMKVWVSDLDPAKLLLAENMGAELIPAEPWGDFFEEKGIETLYDCVGIANLSTKIIESAAVGSDIILVGLAEQESQFKSLQLARKSLTIKGSIIYDHPEDYKKTINLIKKGKILPSKYLSDRYNFEESQQAMERACENDSIKVLINYSNDPN